MADLTHNLSDFWWGVLYGLVPSVPAFISWLGKRFETKEAQEAKERGDIVTFLKDQLDEVKKASAAQIAEIKQQNVDQAAEIKDMRHAMYELMTASGHTQQTVDETKSDTKEIKRAIIEDMTNK